MEPMEHERWMHKIEAALRELRQSTDLDPADPPPTGGEDEDAAAATERDG